jgi:hypothetical protein
MGRNGGNAEHQFSRLRGGVGTAGRSRYAVILRQRNCLPPGGTVLVARGSMPELMSATTLPNRCDLRSAIGNRAILVRTGSR